MWIILKSTKEFACETGFLQLRKHRGGRKLICIRRQTQSVRFISRDVDVEEQGIRLLDYTVADRNGVLPSRR
jgi:hypothetical protein